MKKLRIGMFFLFFIILVVFIGGSFYYKTGLSPVSNNEDKVLVNIEKGSTSKKIASILKDNNLIKSKEIFIFYLKINKIDNLQSGSYELSPNMGVEAIVDKLSKGEVVDTTFKLLFKEGINMRGIVKTIVDNTDNKEEDIYNLLKDEEYLDSLISKYWFITEDIKNKDIYYSLEGYLYPDTYIYYKGVSVKDIFGKMLDQMDKVLSKFKDEIEASNYSVHELLTLASMVEQEGSTKENKRTVASVFYNRLDRGMSLGSDVTTYYGAKLDLNSGKTPNFNENNAYNTRVKQGLPASPICIMGLDAINAVIDPDGKPYLYFVSDKNKKLYFSNTYEEQARVIQDLKAQGLWL